MNTIPGDKDPLNPSGIRIGTQELTRIGMKENEMYEIAEFFEKILIKKEPTLKIKKMIKEFRKKYQEIKFCFNQNYRGYDYHKLLK